MKKSNYKVLGVMSGTSLDGVDIAVCTFSLSEVGWAYEIGTAETIPYSENWKNRLQEAVHFSDGRLHTLNKEYTRFLASLISNFVSKHRITDLDAVCSHGHTILHQPEKGVTLQIGNLPEIAELTGQNVVCNFRLQDVALGGQGAPLVPMGDRLLFPEYDYCLNLGGFANVSLQRGTTRIAYDICPVNIVMNELALTLGVPYDKGGELARSGKEVQRLSTELDALNFYRQLPPKSLGLEWVHQHIWPILNGSDTSAENKLSTFASHAARQIAMQFDEGSSVLVTGGGAYNTYLLEQLQLEKKIHLVVPNSKLVEYKEALIFGLLGILKLRDEVNCLSSVTGAKQDHSGGIIYYL